MKPKLLLCLALVLSGVSASVAQPGPRYVESLDAMVVKTSLIFSGHFSNYSRTVIPSGKHLFKYMLAVQVDEIFKGHPQTPVELTVDVYAYETNEIQQWIGRQTPFLYFINTNDFTSLPRQLVRLDGTLNHFSNFSIQPPIILMDSTELTNSADILAYTRKIAKERFASTNTFWLGGNWYYLEVPVTPALEERAQQLIQSNDWSSQKTGIEALGRFKSAKNIRLLKPLLNDSNYTDVSYNNRPWDNERIYHPRKAAYDVLTNWGVNVSEPVWEEDLPWHYDPNARQELKVQIPSTLSAGRLGPLGDNIVVGSALQTDEWTNVLVGSNMITGVRFEWFVYPDGQPKPSKPIHVEQRYEPTTPLDYFNRARGDDIPVAGQKYIIEMNYTLFETENAPTNRDKWGEIRTDIWRPQDGKNYRVLVEKALRTTSGP